MKIRTGITGVGTTAEERANVRIKDALAKREVELAQRFGRSATADGTSGPSPTSRGGK